MQKITKINFRNFEGGVGKKFLNPLYLPNFGFRELKIFLYLDIQGRYLTSEFRDPNPKNRAWGIK